MTIKLKEKTIKELEVILKEEFGKELKVSEVERIAYYLVGYFDLLSKGAQRKDSEIIR